MAVVAVKSLAELQKLIKESPKLVVDCYATWCGPCRMIAPRIDAMAKEYVGRVTFAKIDVDEARDAAQFLQITAMPTLFYYRDGEKVTSVVGADIARITEAVKSL